MNKPAVEIPVSAEVMREARDLLPCILRTDEHLFADAEDTIHPRSCPAHHRPAVALALQARDDKIADRDATISGLGAAMLGLQAQISDLKRRWEDFNHGVQPEIGLARLSIVKGDPEKAREHLARACHIWDDFLPSIPDGLTKTNEEDGNA